MPNLSQIKKRTGKSIPYTSLGTCKTVVFKETSNSCTPHISNAHVHWKDVEIPSILPVQTQELKTI